MSQDLPNWAISGGADAVGLLVIWWLIRVHVPGLTSAFERSLDRILSESKADREAFCATLEAHKEECIAEQQRVREAADTRERNLLTRLSEKEDQIIQLLKEQSKDRKTKSES